MKASQLEFRFRVPILAAIYVVGFWAPWIRYGDAAPATTLWLTLSTTLARWGWLPLNQSTLLVTSLAIFFAAAGAALRIWGSACLGPAIVQGGQMVAGKVLAAGPYRYLRNPLYLGSGLFSLGVCILMPPSGALFFLGATIIFYLRLILGEEAYLAAQLGSAYLEYARRVPRILPTLRVGTSPPTVHAHWVQALIGEIFPAGFTLCFAVLAWRYEPQILIKCVLICFGLSLVARALVPGSQTAAE